MWVQPPAIVGIEKQKHRPPAGLPTRISAEPSPLSRAATCTVAIGRDHDPAFARRIVGVLDQPEVQFLRINLNGLIEVANDERDMND